MNIEEYRQQHELAVARSEELALQIEGLPTGTDNEVAEELERRFNDAVREAETAKRNWRRAELVLEARSKTLPPQPKDNGGEERKLGEVKVTSEAGEQTYRPDNSNGNFYFRDLYHARTTGDRVAQERLQRNQREIMVERRDLTSTDTAGGDFVSPLYAVNEWIEVVRMGRPFVNALNNRPLPDGTDTIIWPKVTTGTATGAQADIGAVQETDPVTTTVSVGVKTIAGQVDVSQQLLDRSQPGIDQVLFADLRADYNLRLDLQALTGSGSGANAKGVTSDSNRIQVTYTDASPTVAEFYSKVADASQQILTNRGLPADTIVLHPRRWAWIMAASDSTGRPLVVPSGASLNSPGSGGVVDLGQPGFSFQGLNVVIDANLPITQGAGTNEDIAIVMRSSDVVLAERPNPVTRVFNEVLSANLTVRLQLFNYFAFTTERFSKSVATIGGTGLVAPTF